MFSSFNKLRNKLKNIFSTFELCNILLTMIMKKSAALLSFYLITLLTCVGQTVIYSTDFGTDGSFPTGYTNSSQIQISQVGPSTGYTGASGSDYVNCLNNVGSAQTLTVNPPISTVGFENINVIWGARQNNARMEH